MIKSAAPTIPKMLCAGKPILNQIAVAASVNIKYKMTAVLLQSQIPITEIKRRMAKEVRPYAAQ